jgi:hypothetical protein
MVVAIHMRLTHSKTTICGWSMVNGTIPIAWQSGSWFKRHRGLSSLDVVA